MLVDWPVVRWVDLSMGPSVHGSVGILTGCSAGRSDVQLIVHLAWLLARLLDWLIGRLVGV
jgi:hypothetical protein